MLSLEELKKLAELAKIEVPDEELEELRGQLDRILEYVSEVKKADTGNLPEVIVSEHRNVFREDGKPHETGLYIKEIMALPKEKEEGYVEVRKIIER